MCFFAVLCAFDFGVLTVVGIKEGEKLGDALSAVTVGGLLTLVLVFCVITSPKLYVADEKGLFIYYLPFVKDYYEWEEIKRIKVVRRYRLHAYSFESEKHVEKVFFAYSEFYKSFMLKKMIKKYWAGEIEGDDWENLKKKIRTWNKNNNTYVPDDSESEKAEREAGKKIREIINSNKPKAEESNKFIKAVYMYETKSGEYKSRPKESYSYNVEIEIGGFDSSEDERMYIITEVFFVRYGRKNIKIMYNKNAFDEIAEKINAAIEK